MSQPNVYLLPGRSPGQATVLKGAVQFKGRMPRGKPDGVRERALGYLFGLALMEHPSVRLVSLTVMPTHYHFIAIDYGETKQAHYQRWKDRRPERSNAPPPLQPKEAVSGLASLLHWVNGEYAKFLNKLDGTSGTVFEKEAVSLQLLVGDRALIDEWTYLQLNPVKAGLERRPARWRAHFGVGLRRGSFKQSVSETFERHRLFNPSWLEDVDVPFVLPESVMHHSEQELEDVTMELMATRLKTIRKERKQEGKGYLGVKAVSRLNPLTPLPPPEHFEKWRAHELSSSSPRAAPREVVAPAESVDDIKLRKRRSKLRLKCSDPKLFAGWSKRIHAWLDAYDDAYMKWRAGQTDAVFPRGSYKVALYCGATLG